MKFVALISGGKDSCYNIMQCVAAGHKVVALANLQPQIKDELDSYMYQTVGHHGIELYAEAMELPLYREIISGTAIEQGRNYKPNDDDEVEDLYRLLAKVKKELAVEGVAVGAILSDYQRIRVENVCQRLQLVPLAYLWRRNQKELLQEMITSGVEAILIKVAALGLDPKTHLGLSIRDIQQHLLHMEEKYGLNVCGEGGEYETFTLDCPLFKKRLVIDEKDLVIHTDDPIAPVGYLNLQLHLEDKDNIPKLPLSIKTSLDFVGDLSDTVFSEISDMELSETEFESIERIEMQEKVKRSELKPLLAYANDKNNDTDENNTDDDSFKNLDFGFLQFHNENIRQPVLDHSSVYGNKHGWYFIGGIVGEGLDIADATREAIKKLINLLETVELQLSNICSVNIYIRDMREYVALNEVYANTFSFPNPPTRVCVQCPLPKDVGLILDAVAHKSDPNVEGTDDSYHNERLTMHVQSVSHWAPANIGPYSQAIKVGEVIGTCGQIALVPGTMTLVEGGSRRQSTLALRHLNRVIRGVNPRAHIRSVVQSVCYTISGSSITEARRQLERRTAGAIVQYAVVEALPRGAAVEWHAWAHSHNNRFEYEETGCNVGKYKVSITRRWNYENTVAAFVCYVSTGSSSSSQLTFPNLEAYESHRLLASDIQVSEMVDILEYALRKLIHECHVDQTALKMRIFYQVCSSPSMSHILEAVETARTRIINRVAVTVVPVVALHNAFTFLSISGLRINE